MSRGGKCQNLVTGVEGRTGNSECIQEMLYVDGRVLLQAKGELLGEAPATFTILPGALPGLRSLMVARRLSVDAVVRHREVARARGDVVDNGGDASPVGAFEGGRSLKARAGTRQGIQSDGFKGLDGA
jgi:hypothetical protein